jgi:hypothetical protein
MENPPVQTGRDDVLATAYVRNGKTLVAVASWAPDTALVKLTFDWKRLGITRSGASLTAIPIEHFQDAATFDVEKPIPVAPGQGWLLELSARR